MPTTITILNANFEDNGVGDGGSVAVAPTDWTVSADAGAYFGLYNPTSSYVTNDNLYENTFYFHGRGIIITSDFCKLWGRYMTQRSNTRSTSISAITKIMACKATVLSFMPSKLWVVSKLRL